MLTSDFKLRKYQNGKIQSNVFTVILKSKNNVKKKPSKCSLINAARPLISFSSIFGIQTMNRNTIRAKLLHRIYAVILITIIISLIIFVKPDNWDDTIKDIPLKILNISMGIQETFEIVFFIFITSFRNTGEYIKMYKTLSAVDDHFKVCKKMFTRRRSLSIVLIFIPIAALLLTVWLRIFSVHNLVSHLIFFLLMLQGAICAFFLINMYSDLIIFHALLLKKSQHLNIPKRIVNVNSTRNIVLLKRITGNAQIRNPKNICWFELMQIYDKIADTVYIFNRIYNEQVLIMFNSWFMTTLLAICRILSPTVQYSDIIVNETLLYFLINSRPIFITKMSECFDIERRKIFAIVLHHKVYQNKDYHYKDQVDMMMDLIQTRKMDISTIAFSVNIRVMMNFTGRVISYAVLMIQYFYLYIHEIEKN